MTVRVYKYSFGDEPQLVVPFGISDKVVLVSEQLPSQGFPTMWVEHSLIESAATKGTFRTFRCFPTGLTEMEDEWGHVGSAVCGQLVWHVYGKKWLENAQNERVRLLW